MQWDPRHEDLVDSYMYISVSRHVGSGPRDMVDVVPYNDAIVRLLKVTVPLH